MPRALISIDYTHDFVALDGALTVGQKAVDLEDSVLSISKAFQNNPEDLLVFAIDTHFQDDPFHPESQLFPPHNIAGTPGHDLYGQVENYYQSIKNEKNVIYLEKTRYSAFCGTPLHQILTSRQIKDLYLIGVCTDICILHTAMDAYNLGYKIHIFQDGVASFNEVGHEWALGHFKNCLGAEILTIEEEIHRDH